MNRVFILGLALLWACHGAPGSPVVCNCSTLDCAKAALESPGSRDCGLVGLHGDEVFEGDGGVECALQAQDAGQPFSLQVDQMGVDTSDDHLFLRRGDGSSFDIALHSSASFGGGAAIAATACSGFTAIDPVTGDAGTQTLSCESPEDNPRLPCQ